MKDKIRLAVHRNLLTVTAVKDVNDEDAKLLLRVRVKKTVLHGRSICHIALVPGGGKRNCARSPFDWGGGRGMIVSLASVCVVYNPRRAEISSIFSIGLMALAATSAGTSISGHS